MSRAPRARIIRGGQLRQPVRDPQLAAVLRAKDLEAAAARGALLEQAEQQAAAIVAAARAEAEVQRDALLDVARQEAVATALEAQRLAEAHVAAAQAELTSLAVGIAEKILGAQLAERPERVAEIVAQALRAAGQSRRFVARVHPEDLPLLETRRAELAAAADTPALNLRADPTVARGGCILETDRGVVDARLEVQLSMIATALAGGSTAQHDAVERPEGQRGSGLAAQVTAVQELSLEQLHGTAAPHDFPGEPVSSEDAEVDDDV